MSPSGGSRGIAYRGGELRGHKGGGASGGAVPSQENFWILKVTRRMAIANRTCVSFCNQPKSKFGYLTRVTAVCLCLTRFADGSIWLCQNSLRHILASRGYAPGTIMVNVTWMKRGFNAYQTNCSMYTHLYSTVSKQFNSSSKIRHFSTFFAHASLGTPLGQSR